MIEATEVTLYGTIWLAVVLFVIGEAAKRPVARRVPPARWAWAVSAAGALLCGAHMLLALAVRHDWQHSAAVIATAHQTESIYGIAWGGGVYANYAFLATWFVELFWWRFSPARYFARSVVITWLLRGFYFVILVNALVVFAAPARRPAGSVLMGVLLWAWRPGGVRTGTAVRVRT